MNSPASLTSFSFQFTTGAVTHQATAVLAATTALIAILSMLTGVVLDSIARRNREMYRLLVDLTQSPIVELNRAVAVSMAEGPAAGLRIADALVSEPLLASYHLLPSVRGDLLEKLGRNSEAAAEFDRAASLTRNVRERDVLLGRAAACRSVAGA